MPALAAVTVQSTSNKIETVKIAGGRALQGTDFPIYPVDGEGPLREQKIEPFEMAPTTVTNQQFAAFVLETGYVTEAERFGWSFVFSGALARQEYAEEQVENLPWWCKVNKANWSNPKGSDTVIEEFRQLPAVHVSYNDAAAFAMWAGGRLPTESEWEHAARAGLGDIRYPWGDDDPQADGPKCCFGLGDSIDLCPEQIGPVAADAFLPNGYGLYNMVGNIWEWTSSDSDLERGIPATHTPQKVLKGGSYLCHPNSCFRHRIAARISNTIDTSTGHTGFRLVFT